MELIRVETKLGTIVAEKAPYEKDYPGIWLALERNGERVGLVLMDVCQPDEDNPELIIRVWDVADSWGDPRASYVYDADTVNKMFGEEE